MSDDLVKRICQKWIDAGYADECFCQMYPRCSAKGSSLTPRMVFDRIEALEAKLAKAVEGVEKMNVGEGWAAQIARATLAELTGDPDGN